MNASAPGYSFGSPASALPSALLDGILLVAGSTYVLDVGKTIDEERLLCIERFAIHLVESVNG